MPLKLCSYIYSYIAMFLLLGNDYFLSLSFFLEVYVCGLMATSCTPNCPDVDIPLNAVVQLSWQNLFEYISMLMKGGNIPWGEMKLLTDVFIEQSSGGCIQHSSYARPLIHIWL